MRWADDRYRRTVRVPVTVEKGVVVELGREGLPAIRDGAVGELVLDAEALSNPADRSRLLAEQVVPLLPAGAELWVRVSPRSVPPELEQHLSSPENFGFPLVRIILKTPLNLCLRGTKAATLMAVECVIPALKLEAKSVNHAYRLISEKFEPHRLAHGGNVFEEVFIIGKGDLQPLDYLRDGATAASEIRQVSLLDS